MTQNLIGGLEQDKKYLQAEVVRLHAIIDRFGPENARLCEALSNAESNSVIATILVGVGGFLVSYATFTGNLAKSWADVSAGLLLAGIGLMIWQSVRRWRRGPT